MHEDHGVQTTFLGLPRRCWTILFCEPSQGLPLFSRIHLLTEMRPIYRKTNVSREGLAFTPEAMGIPPRSELTWILVFFLFSPVRFG